MKNKTVKTICLWIISIILFITCDILLSIWRDFNNPAFILINNTILLLLGAFYMWLFIKSGKL